MVRIDSVLIILIFSLKKNLYKVQGGSLVAKAFGLGWSFAVFPGAFADSWFGSGAPWIGTAAHIECWYGSQYLNTLCHNNDIKKVN